MKTLAFLTSFYNINGTLEIRKDYFKHLSKNLKEVYIINTDNLMFLPSIAKLSFSRTQKEEAIYSKLPKNIKLFNTTLFNKRQPVLWIINGINCICTFKCTSTIFCNFLEFFRFF